MPHVVVAGKIHEAGLALLKSAPGFTFDLVNEVSSASYAPFMPKADALLIRTQPLHCRSDCHIERAQNRIPSRRGL